MDGGHTQVNVVGFISLTPRPDNGCGRSARSRTSAACWTATASTR